jgi:hypothetical protein
MTEPKKHGAIDTPQSRPGTTQPGHRSLPQRIRFALRKRFPRLFDHSFDAEAREFYKTRDPDENLKTTPPADELIDLRCLWAVEFYTPAHIENLLACFRRLGWHQDDVSASRNNPVAWIQRLRERPTESGWFNLGHIRAPASDTFLARSRTAPLPQHVAYATGGLYSLTSSLHCIVIGFMFDDEYSQRLDRVLRTDRQTYLKRTRRGHQVFRPQRQKADFVRQIRGEAIDGASSWFREYLPGLFSSGILSGEFPTCEFVALRQAEPFPPRPEGSARPPAYLSVLDMEFDANSWACVEMPGLKFTWPMTRTGNSRYHAVLAIREGDFDTAKLSSWGGTDRSAQISYVDRKINGLLSRWAILPLLAGYGRHLNTIRDSATLRSDSRSDPVKVLKSLGDHVSYNVDIAAVTAELIPFAEQPGIFEHEVEAFRSCDPHPYEDAGYLIARGLRSQIGEQAAWLQNTDRSLRDRYPAPRLEGGLS